MRRTWRQLGIPGLVLECLLSVAVLVVVVVVLVVVVRRSGGGGRWLFGSCLMLKA